MEKLKPCPFCGGEAKLQEQIIAPICPLHSDEEVTEYCIEGPCGDEQRGKCPLAERSEK